MLDNVITLSIDEANNGTLVDLDYTRYDEYNNRTVYISANHVPGTEDKLIFYRTFPTPSGNFKGTRKTAMKFSRAADVVGNDGGSIATAMILEVSLSLPVGVSAADAMKLRQAAIAALNDDTLMVKFHEQQNI